MSANRFWSSPFAGLRPSPAKVIFAFVGYWSLLNGTGVKETSLAICFLYLQTAIGTTVSTFTHSLQLTRTGELAIGFGFGALLVTIVDQIIINLGIPTQLSSILLITFGLLCRNRLKLLASKQITTHDWRLVLLSPAAVVFGLSVSDKWHVIATILLFAALSFSYWNPIKNDARNCRKLAVLGVVSFSLVASISKLVSRSSGPWFLRQLFTGSDDQIFSQSIGWSLANFGIGEYPSAIGISIRYHWFSLAWSGLIERFSSAQPFATSLHIVPTVIFIMVLLAFVQLVLLLAKSAPASLWSAFVLFVTASTIEPYRFISVINISNLVPYLWVTTLAILLYALANGSLRMPYLVLPIFQGAILLAKSPFGVVTIVAASSAIIFIHFVSKKRSLSLLLLIWTFSVLIFLVFLYPYPWEQRSFQFGNTFNGVSSDRPLHLVITLAVFLIIVSSGVAGLFIMSRRRTSHAQIALLTFLGTGVACGYFRFLLSGGSAELYFLNVTFFCIAPIIGTGIAYTTENLPTSDLRRLSCVLALSFLLMTLEFHTHWFSERVGSQLVWSFFAPTITVAITGLLMPTRQFHQGRMSYLIACITLVVTVGTTFSTYLSQMSSSVLPSTSEELVSPDELQALSWLRSNSAIGDVVATNQGLCEDEYACQIDQSRFLISAFSQRRVLIEGPRFVVGGSPYPDWVKERISLCLRFHATPNSEDFRALRNFGVEWFYDFHPSSGKVLDGQRWTEFGVIRYKNDSVTIIELNQEILLS